MSFSGQPKLSGLRMPEKKKKDKNGAKYKIMKLKFEVELLAKTQLINSHYY